MGLARKRLAVLLAIVAPRHGFSLQVSPNSPCADVCLDSPNLDRSDPNSSNTRPSDMTCKDAEYSTTPAGLKWQSCMSCLEKSGYSQGDESDQGWFLYNVRYNFNWCVFGYPNNTKVGSNPCQTSRACDGLRNALEYDGLSTSPTGDYGYCNADGGAVTGEFYAKCLACIGSFRDQVYVTNGLVALEAGCLQRPAPGKTLGLNATIFSSRQIGVVDPAESDDHHGGSGTPTTTIVVAVISTVIALAAVAAVAYMCIRKRRNRRDRAAGRRHRPQSSLSFWCPTPKNPGLFPDGAGGAGSPVDEAASSHEGDDSQPTKRRYIVSVHQNQSSDGLGGAHQPHTLWRSANPVSSLSPVDEDRLHEQKWRQQQQQQQEGYSHATAAAPSEKSALGGLHQLTTALPLAPLRHAHTSSPQSGSVNSRMSPQSATPTSATQLLPSYSSSGGRGSFYAPYVPADHAPPSRPFRGPSAAELYQHQHARQHQQSPAASSPQQQWGWPAPAPTGSPPPPPPPKSPRIGGGGGGRKGGYSRESGSPVETKAIQTSFPGPPRR